MGARLDSFSGAAAGLPKGKRSADNVLRTLAKSPRVSVWDRDAPWLDNCLRRLMLDGLIRERGEPYPWYRYELTVDGRAALRLLEPAAPIKEPLTKEELIAGMLDDGEAQARAAIDEAGELIWNSIQKFNGEPGDEMGHPLACGCVYCN